MSTYREAGVDLEAADKVVASIGDAVTATWGPNVVGSFGGFAGGFRIPNGYVDPILMMSTDGIGTKLDLARRLGQLGGVGFDLVAMVIDDLAAAGALPLAMTDYIAVGRLDPAEVTAIVSSIARACTEAEVALIGGETAEHPGTLPAESLDVAATAVGVIEAAEMFDPNTINSGDVVVGVASPNLRSNGFSLVRSIVGNEIADTPIGDQTLIEALVEPSVIYSPAAIAAKSNVKAYVHVTGGGLPGNIPRVLPESVDVLIDTSAWQPPPIFTYLQTHGSITDDEMSRVFNMGVGFVAIAASGSVEAILTTFAKHGHSSFPIGIVVDGVGIVRFEGSKSRDPSPRM